jgi:hypothetical protein
LPIFEVLRAERKRAERHSAELQHFDGSTFNKIGNVTIRHRDVLSAFGTVMFCPNLAPCHIWHRDVLSKFGTWSYLAP